MKIEKLDWDAGLFGYCVKKTFIEKENEDYIPMLLQEDFKLLYIFSNKKLSENFIAKTNAILVDEKIFLSKKTTAGYDCKMNKELKSINVCDENILQLAYQSGEFSRYKKDPGFVKDEFKKLYSIWLQKSLTHEIADEVTAYIIDGNIRGFITLSKKNNAASIDLIAVDTNYRRQNIGSALLNVANDFAIKNFLEKIIVNTQAENLNAVAFYKKNLFEIAQTTFVYHLWK